MVLTPPWVKLFVLIRLREEVLTPCGKGRGLGLQLLQERSVHMGGKSLAGCEKQAKEV